VAKLKTHETSTLPPDCCPAVCPDTFSFCFSRATEPNIFSDEQEIYLGDAIAARIQNQYHVIEDPEITII
jgi:predicted Zn-dependent protease